MLNTLKLLLPVIVPSWRFFDVIAPSPRIEFALLKDRGNTSTVWKEFQPRPHHVSLFQMIKRMPWNAKWNDTLFLMSCAERLIDYPTKHSENEIFDRILNGVTSTDYRFVQFRLVFIKRVKSDLEKHVLFVSSIRPSIAVEDCS